MSVNIYCKDGTHVTIPQSIMIAISEVKVDNTSDVKTPFAYDIIVAFWKWATKTRFDIKKYSIKQLIDLMLLAKNQYIKSLHDEVETCLMTQIRITHISLIYQIYKDLIAADLATPPLVETVIIRFAVSLAHPEIANLCSSTTCCAHSFTCGADCCSHSSNIGERKFKAFGVVGDALEKLDKFLLRKVHACVAGL
jgi:hypothetical protein